MGDGGACLVDHLQPLELAGEDEGLARDGDGVSDLDESLGRRGGFQVRRDHVALDDIEAGEEPQRRLDRDVRRAREPMLAAFDQGRGLRAVLVREGAVVAQAYARRMTLVADHVFGHADGAAELAALLRHAGERQGRGQALHGMDVEQIVDLVDDRPKLARAAQLDRVAAAA